MQNDLIEDWNKKMSNAKSHSEIQALLRLKPKGARAITSGQTIMNSGKRGDYPLLDKLTGG